MIVPGNNLIFRISKAKLNESANLKLDFIGSILEQSILWKSGIDHYTGPPWVQSGIVSNATLLDQ